MVLTEALLSAVFGEAIQKYLLPKLDELKPKEIQVVNVKPNPEEFSITILDDATTTLQSFGDLKTKPQLTFENPLEIDSFIQEITILPDTAFKTKGKCIVTVDDIPVFKSKKFTSFSLISETVIKVNKTIKKDSKLKVFMISSDGSAVGLAVQVTFGD